MKYKNNYEIKDNNIEDDTYEELTKSIAHETEDDMVLADMSLVRKRRVLFPDRIRNEDSLGSNVNQNLANPNIANPSKPYSNNSSKSIHVELSPDETKWAILGTLKAALLIGSAYAVGLGGLILLMVLLFKHFG